MSYLDGTGLATLWAKIKQYVRDNATSSIPDGSVTAAKLADGSVSTAKLADDSVTPAKLADDLFVVETVTLVENYTLTPNGGYTSGAISASKTGYNLMGILGFWVAGTNARWCVVEEASVSRTNNAVYTYVWNQHQSANAVITVCFDVLYMKAS